MRTKTLLLTAMIGAASVVASLAQTSNAVYSVNVVGYVTLTIDNATNFRIISNPLITTNNSLNALIPTFAPGAQIYKLLPGGTYSVAGYDPDLGGWDPNFEVATGEGVFIKLASAGSFPVTFVGEVAQNAASNKQLPVGLSLQGSLVPQAGSIISVLQVPGEPGDQLYKLNPSGAYTVAGYDPDLGGWDPDVSIDVAEGFFFNNIGAAPLPWNRNFVVPQ